MNAFYEHHKNSIQFGYRCFDRLLLNGLIQPFQQPERVLGFFNTYRQGKRVTRRTLTEIADQFQNWLKGRSEKWGAPVLEAPDDERRDDFVQPYLKNCEADRVAVILKAREPARILVAVGGEKNDSPHLEFKQRWVNQFNFYLNDERWGRMFVRMCPYFPFSARVCLNQHHWLAIRMREEGIDFQQCTNAFLKCGNPARLQELADSLTTQDLLKCGQKWLAAFTPFITDKERKHAGCQHRLFFSQVEYCDNLIFHRRAAVDELTERLLDLNRTIGQPKKITMIFGRKVTKEYKGKLQTVIEDLDLPNPVIRSHYGHGFAKQYVRDDRLLRTEPATNNVYDYGVNKDVENLPRLRDRMSEIIDNYHNVQQDILETFVDRGQLRKLAEPTVLPGGKRIPGLKLDHPRHWQRCIHSCASPTLLPAAPLPPPTSMPQLWMPLARPNRSIHWPRSAMTFPNCAPKACSRRSRAPAAIDWLARAIRYAWSSSSSSKKSMRLSRQACWRHFAATVNWPRKNAANWTACIKPSATIWTHSCGLSGSRLPPDFAKREQNSRCAPYNGN